MQNNAELEAELEHCPPKGGLRGVPNAPAVPPEVRVCGE